MDKELSEFNQIINKKLIFIQILNKIEINREL